jgi:Uma2 family endonuclease
MKTSAPEKILLTYEDYAALPNDGRRYEIIEGEVFMSPSPKQKHQSVIVALTEILASHVRTENLGRIYVAPFDVLLSEHDIVQPDLVFVSESRRAIITADNIQGVPDLVIEVLSPSSARLDVVTKKSIYARCGVPNYWIVDPDREQVELFELDGSNFRRTAMLEGNVRFGCKLFPKLRFPLGRLWK